MGLQVNYLITEFGWDSWLLGTGERHGFRWLNAEDRALLLPWIRWYLETLHPAVKGAAFFQTGAQDDWREFESLDMDDGVLSEAQKKGLSLGQSRQNYLQAVDNTLEALDEFISSLEMENSVIVLIGDHQPPAVSRHEDGYGTMVHIISQDVDLLASFYEYGFVDGLVLENLEPTIRHEGLYSLFVRNFVAQYGISPWMLPPYLPNGLQ